MLCSNCGCTNEVDDIERGANHNKNSSDIHQVDLAGMGDLSKKPNAGGGSVAPSHVHKVFFEVSNRIIFVRLIINSIIQFCLLITVLIFLFCCWNFAFLD